MEMNYILIDIRKILTSDKKEIGKLIVYNKDSQLLDYIYINLDIYNNILSDIDNIFNYPINQHLKLIQTSTGYKLRFVE